jgi:hypothetical protein
MQSISFFEGVLYILSIIGLMVFCNGMVDTIKTIDFGKKPSKVNIDESNLKIAKNFIQTFFGITVFMIALLSTDSSQFMLNKTTYIATAIIAVGLLLPIRNIKRFINYLKYRNLKKDFANLVTIGDDFNSLAPAIFKINDALKIINLKLESVKDEDDKKDLECMQELLNIKKNNLSEISKTLRDNMAAIK